MSNATYQKINWGWLNDYNGYKFAPITFVEQLYTEEGYSFKEKYNQKWQDLEDGNIVAGKALKLVDSLYEPYITGTIEIKDEDGNSLGFNSDFSKHQPIFFENGIPKLCDDNLITNILGNINVLDQKEYIPTIITEQTDFINGITYYKKSTNGGYEETRTYDSNTVYYIHNPNYTSSNIRSEIINLLKLRQNANTIIETYNSNSSVTREELNHNINIYNEAQENLNNLTSINGGIISGNNFKFINPLNITIGNTTKSINESNSSITWSHSDIGYASSNKSGLISTENQTIPGTKTFINSIKISVKNKGYYLTDGEENLYAALYDNGVALWLGSTSTTGTPHYGYTVLSSGYDAANNKGNDSVKISIPTKEDDDTWTQSWYDIIHTNNFKSIFSDNLATLDSSITTSKNINLLHPYTKTEYGTQKEDKTWYTGYQQLGFYSKDGVQDKYLMSKIISQYAHSDSYESNRNYLKLTTYHPGEESTSKYAELYLYINEDGESEAGVRSAGVTVAEDNYSSGSVVFMGAAWNDYAEFRDQIETIEPGYCVASTDDGKVYKTSEKFQACDGIVSDTYGFAIGRSETYQTPLAVSGRVLAYCEGSRYDYHAGDTVCAGPEGKVCKMTREEIKEYPDRIVGIVSEIPEYEEWTGKKIKNRIWIKVK